MLKINSSVLSKNNNKEVNNNIEKADKLRNKNYKNVSLENTLLQLKEAVNLYEAAADGVPIMDTTTTSQLRTYIADCYEKMGDAGNSDMLMVTNIHSHEKIQILETAVKHYQLAVDNYNNSAKEKIHEATMSIVYCYDKIADLGAGGNDKKLEYINKILNIIQERLSRKGNDTYDKFDIYTYIFKYKKILAAEYGLVSDKMVYKAAKKLISLFQALLDKKGLASENYYEKYKEDYDKAQQFVEQYKKTIHQQSSTEIESAMPQTVKNVPVKQKVIFDLNEMPSEEETEDKIEKENMEKENQNIEEPRNFVINFEDYLTTDEENEQRSTTDVIDITEADPTQHSREEDLNPTNNDALNLPIDLQKDKKRKNEIDNNEINNSQKSTTELPTSLFVQKRIKLLGKTTEVFSESQPAQGPQNDQEELSAVRLFLSTFSDPKLVNANDRFDNVLLQNLVSSLDAINTKIFNRDLFSNGQQGFNKLHDHLITMDIFKDIKQVYDFGKIVNKILAVNANTKQISDPITLRLLEIITSAIKKIFEDLKKQYQQSSSQRNSVFQRPLIQNNNPSSFMGNKVLR